MFLVRLIYTSRPTTAFQLKNLDDILQKSQVNNKALGLTGALCFTYEHFLQCLEGGRTVVNQTYQRILQDPRHSDVILLDYQEIAQREFAEWSMGCIPNNEITQAQIFRYSVQEAFNPYNMSGASALALLKALKREIPMFA